jgi:hemerythrin-like metal-binding protein
MPSPRWDKSLETGDPLVDRQHRDIHALVNYVAAADDRPDELLRVLDRLTEYVDCHFTTEEGLMHRSGYVGTEADRHIAEHQELKQAARDAVLQYRMGKLNSTKPLVEFLRTWLSEHVHGRDRALVEFVRSRGETATLPEPWASDPSRLNSLSA